MVGIDPRACGLAHAQTIFCQLSPLHLITLDDETKVAANIPEHSKYFAWAYPAVDDGTFRMGTSAEHHFLLYGGYVYFCRDRKAIGTNSIAPAPLGTEGLMFGRAQDLATPVEQTLTRQGRFQEITLAPMRKAGATHFAWIRPSEFSASTAATDGAFAYKFGGGQAKYFPVVSSPVFTPEMLSEELADHEAWVVVRPHHPTVEKVVVFDRSLTFNENMQSAGIGGLVRADDGSVLASRNHAKEPIPYSVWQEASEPGTVTDPWIFTLRSRGDLTSQLLGNDAVES